MASDPGGGRVKRPPRRKPASAGSAGESAGAGKPQRPSGPPPRPTTAKPVRSRRKSATGRPQAQELPAVQLRGEFITLDSLLKVAGVADSGGAAKVMVAQGMVTVDGLPETRKTAKIRPGQRVEVGGITIRVAAAPAADA